MELTNQQLAEQLRKLKMEHQAKQIMRDNIIASDPEIQSMRKKIELSYMTKERAQQLVQKQVRTLEEKTLEAQMEAEMIARTEKDAKRKEQERKAIQRRQIQNQKILTKQIEGKRQLQNESRNEYLKEKQHVNRQVQKLIDDERKRIQNQQQKKRAYYNTMIEQYELKDQIRLENERVNRLELEKISQYQGKLDQRDRQQKMENQRKEKQKEVIYLKLKAAEQQRQRQLDQLQQLRLDYYQFVSEEQYQKKQAQEQRKREEFKRLLREAERQQKELKEKQKSQQAFLEEQFRIKMLQRMAQQEKLDQMAREKKRMKQQEHKRQVQKLWQIKLQQYRQAKQQEQRQIEQKRLIQLWRVQIVQQQKERMLREHANNLNGFLHPELVERARKVANYTERPQSPGYLDNYRK